MNSSSHSSFRPPPKAQLYQSEPDIFSNSFYAEKVSSDSYTSYEFVKRYLNETNLNAMIEKVVGVVLGMDKLPFNPYNILYRLMHHETIYQNLRLFYNQGREYQNMINYNLNEDEQRQQSNFSKSHQQMFTTIRLRDKEVHLTERLAKYVNMTNLFLFFQIVYSKRVIDWLAVLQKKYDFQAEISYGGPILLNLRGNMGSLDMPVKMGRQQAERSIYCCQAMLTTTTYLRSSQPLTKAIPKLVNLIMQDLLEAIQYKDNNYTIYFQKLQLFNVEQLFNVMEFSRQQVLASASLVEKEIGKSLERENMVVRSHCIYRLSKQQASIVGEQFITVQKQYILISKQQSNVQLLSNQPLKYAFREIFIHSSTITSILMQQQYVEKDLLVEYKSEMVTQLIHELNNQNIGELMWQIFYYMLYENYEKQENIQFVDDLNKTVSYVLLSPIAFVQQLAFRLRCIKWLTMPSFPTFNEGETYRIIIDLERQIMAYIQRGNFIYWELQVFYEAIKRLLSLIVEFKQLKKNSIIFIVDHALLMLNGVASNFNQILLVLQGNILSYISLMRQNLIQDKQLKQSQIISYEEYLRGKELPTRVLQLPEEIKKVKKQLNMQDSEVKQILIAKYVSKYDLYSKIYQFYWAIFTGKKVLFPLSNFLKLLMINSTQCAFQYLRQNQIDSKHKVVVHTVNGIPVYQISNPQTSFQYYALDSTALQANALKQYTTVMELIMPFIEEKQIESESNLGYRYGRKNSMDSSGKQFQDKSKIKNIVSIKSMDMGENISKQINSSTQCRIFVDVILQYTFGNKYELYCVVLDYINSLITRMDKQTFSVVGLYSYLQNDHHVITSEESIYTKLLNDDSVLRYDYKQKWSIDKFMKFIDRILAQSKLLEAKAVYKVRDVLKVIKISFNFYYKATQKSNYTSIFATSYIQERVFQDKKDLLSWCQVNQIDKINEALKGKVQKGPNNSKKEMLSSLKRLHEQKQISIVQILSELQLEREENRPLNKSKYYRQSPFYNILQRSLELLQNLHVLIDYLKIDRRSRYNLSHISSIHSILKFYLIDRCLLKDDYIYSEGASVSIVNLMTYVREYIDKHSDNNGEERELLYLQRVIVKLINMVKYAQISCTICIHQSLNIQMDQQKPISK